MRILLAEASIDQQLLIRTHLRPTAHHMDVVEDGLMAVEAFKSRRFDVVLIHIDVPVLPGLGALAAMRAWEGQSGNNSIPIVALVDRKADAPIATAAGFNAVLFRPVTDARSLFDCFSGLRWPQNTVVWTGGVVDDRSKRIPVRVDPELRALIPIFLEKRAKDLQELKVALKANDLERIRRTGHRLKGKGSGYGFPGISKVGDALEHAVSLRDVFGIRDAIEELASYLARIEIIE